MLPFSPEKSRLFQAAAFSLIYSSILFVTIRLAVFTFLILVVVLLLTNDVRHLPYVIFSLLGLATMFELFYRFHISKLKPAAAVTTLSQNTNLADLVNFELAKLMLSYPYWNTTDQLLKSLTRSNKIKFFLYKADMEFSDLSKAVAQGEKIEISSVLQTAAAYASKEGLSYIDPLEVLLALFATSPSLQKLAFDKELKQNDIENIAHWSRNSFDTGDNIPFWEKKNNIFGLGMAAVWMGGWTLETEKFTTDITAKALKERKEYLVGREREVKQVIEVLLRSVKRNAILLGEPGIGKSTIISALAAKSFKGELPIELDYKRFMELDITAINASAGEGTVEERLKNILMEVSHAGDVVIFIPQIENLAGALERGKFDISGLLADTLKDINLQVIGTSDRASYRRYIESKAAFSNNFEIIDVPEPNSDEAIRIVEEAALKMEARTGTVITYKAVQKAIELSERYIVDKVLPGKAIDLLDQGASANALAGKKLVEGPDIEQIVTQKTKVPAGLAEGEEKQKLLQLEQILHQRIVGQDEAIFAVSEAIKRARTLKRDSKKPIGVFLFLGPTGVGKTETAKALAQVYYGSEERIIRVNMSEFNQETSVYRLIGSPPGMSEYEEGGQLTEAVRANPFSLVLLDELEKAHPKVEEVFLAIFDEGRITDASGKPVSFTNTIIIGTSNAGAEYIREAIQQNTEVAKLKTDLIEKLLHEGTFKPEFLNRFDDVIVYKPLLTNQVEQVVAMMLTSLVNRLSKQDLNVEISPEVVAYVATKGYDPQFGARPLIRTIQDEIESKISQAVLEGKLVRGATAKLNLVNNTIVVE